MKKFTILMMLLICTVSLNAQDISFTFVKENYPMLYQNIADNAAKKWDSDYTMQKYTIEQQCQAFTEYFELKSSHDYDSIPDDVINKIRVDAVDVWSDHEYAEYGCQDKHGDEFYACLSLDWQMFVSTMKSQLDAYKAIKK